MKIPEQMVWLLALMEQIMDEAKFEDFLKLDIRCGTITSAQPFPEARKPAVKLELDFGAPFGRRKSSAQIKTNYKLETLVGKQVLAVVNLQPRQIGPFMSEVLTLGVPDLDGEVVLVVPDKRVPDGGKLY